MMGERTKSIIFLAIVIILLIGVNTLLPSVSASETLTNVSELYQYPLHFDNNPCVITGFVNGTPVSLIITGNISVINQPLGGDLILQLMILITICVFFITVMLIAYFIYSSIKLNKIYHRMG